MRMHKLIKKVFLKKENIVSGLLLLGIAVFLLMIIVTNVCHFTYCLDADISSEVVLAREIWDVKQLVPDTWYISTEARIIGTPNLAAPFYGLTHNMVLAMGLACSVMTLLITFSMFFFGKSLGLKFQDNLLFIFMGLAVPVLFDFLEMLYLFTGYYASHIISLFLTLGVYVAALGGKRINRGIFILSILLALVLGIQGVRGILVFYGPLFGMEVIRNLYRIYCREKADKMDLFVSVWVAVMLALSFIGTLFPVSVEQEMSRNIRKGFQKLFTIVIPNMGIAIGLKAANPAEKIALVFMLLLVLYLVLDTLWRMCRKRKIEAVEWAFLVICASPVITALMMAFTTFDTAERYYFMFTYVMAFAVVLAFGKLRRSHSRWTEIALSLLLSLSVVVIAVSNLIAIYVPIMNSEEPPQTEDNEIAGYLEKNDFHIAYSTFHRANNLTVLSNGKVRGAAISSLDKMNVSKWLSSYNWYVPNLPYEEKTAYIIPETEMEDFAKFLEIHGEEMQFETQIGKYSVYSSDYNFSNLED